MASVSKISFGSGAQESQQFYERHRKRPLVNKISSITDEEIIRASVKNADSQMEKSTAARVLRKGPLMFFAATSIAWGMARSGKLSDKLVTSAQMLGAAAVVSALSKPVDKIVDKTMNSKNDKNSENHPFAKLVIGTSALVAASGLAIFAAAKGTHKLAATFKPTADGLKDTFVKHAEKLDNGPVGKFVERQSGKFEHFAKFHPKLAKTTKNLLKYFPLAGYIGGTAVLSEKIEQQREEITKSNIKKLLFVRQFASEIQNDLQ